METQYAEAEEELIAEVKEKATTITIKDFTPAGVRAEYNVQGETRGRYNARHIETVNVLFKPDGIVEYESKGIDTTPDGEIVLITSKGKGTMGLTGSFEGESTFQTPSKKLAWLNNIKGLHRGTMNLMTDEASYKLYKKK
ncbi:MAG TPA: hypothetical protein VNA15_03220 [Candidatus Angelobacter sp.]|nr:hypothetical protein [Candidatus Angelobacter sp.]